MVKIDEVGFALHLIYFVDASKYKNKIVKLKAAHTSKFRQIALVYEPLFWF